MLSIVIPAYNEAARIEASLERVREYLLAARRAAEVVVVDDGSTDATRAIVENFAGRFRVDSTEAPSAAPPAGCAPLSVCVLGGAGRHGKGYAVRAGMLAAQGDPRLLCDADLSAPIEELERLLPWIDAGYDVVIGSRDMPDSRLDPPQPLGRRILARGFRWLRRRLLLPELRDTQAGFKLFRAAAAEAIFQRLTLDGWLFDCEALSVAQQLGFRVREVGIRWGASRPSRVRPLRELAPVLRDLLRLSRHARRS
jgi:dolichyl-phosphate beta-glucosyltransferase